MGVTRVCRDMVDWVVLERNVNGGRGCKPRSEDVKDDEEDIR